MSPQRRGVLFDVDGTLVDTTFLHAVHWAEALRQHGHDVSCADVHHAIGMSSDQLLERLLGEDRDTGQDDAITAAHDTLYRQEWGRLRLLPAAADLLRACAARGLEVVLASSASDPELAELCRTIDADDAVSATTSSSDADAGKPAPDIVQVALQRTGLDADQAVFVGDAVWDGAACRQAGVTFVGLTCGGTPEQELRDAGAVEVWRDPADLLENLGDDSVVTRS